MTKHNTDAIKSLLTVEAYCALIGVDLKRSGSELRAACPLPDCGTSGRRPFAVERDGTGWRCNACDVGGDVIRLILCMEFGGDENRIGEAISRAAEIAGTDKKDRSELKAIAEAARERQKEEAARKLADRRTAMVMAPDYWRSCKSTDDDGLAYLESRGVRAAKSDVRFKSGRICLALRDEQGKVINVVTRRYAGEGGKLRSLKNCPTLGIFGNLADIAHTLGPIILVEGVFDYLTARVLAPWALVIGVHGAGRWADVVRMIAHVARERGIIFVPHWLDMNRVGALKVAEAIVVARAEGITDVRRMELETGDLNDFHMAGGDVDRLLNAPPVDDPGAQRTYTRTDLGLAEHFAVMHGKRLKFVKQPEEWREYDGRRWRIASRKVELVQAAAEVAAAMLRDARRENNNDAIGWAMRAQNSKAIEPMIKYAAARREVAANQSEFDQRRDLFNAANGVIDLRSGALLPHDAGYRFTQCSEVAYDPDAKAPRWEKFLSEVFRTNPEDAEFMRRFLGYSLTGETNAQAALFLHGSGGNGKGVICRMLALIMNGQQEEGEGLCAAIPADLLLQKDIQRISPEYYLHGLIGRRAALIGEGGKGDILETRLFKTITGEDPITARLPRGIPVTFKSLAKLIFASNHLPFIDPTDHATWRRVLLVPFHENFRDRRDPGLEPALMEELPGILAWAVRGARDWYDFGEGIDGLQETDSMRTAKAEYREYTDDIGRFLNECTERLDRFPPGDRDGMMVPVSTLYKRFQSWCRRNGITDVPTQNSFGRTMKTKGLASQHKGSRGRCYPVALVAEGQGGGGER